jgi:uncharacterized protein
MRRIFHVEFSSRAFAGSTTRSGFDPQLDHLFCITWHRRNPGRDRSQTTNARTRRRLRHLTFPPLNLKLFHRSTGICMAQRVTLAHTGWTRLRGLIGRKSLAPDEVLWIRPCNGVHTFWMRFSIDVVFLDRQMFIVKLIENMRPFCLSIPKFSSRSVIEMPASSISKYNLQLGDQLQIRKDDL